MLALADHLSWPARLLGFARGLARPLPDVLLAGIALSLFYMAGAALITPALGIEPLGVLLKTASAIVPMLATLAIIEDR